MSSRPPEPPWAPSREHARPSGVDPGGAAESEGFTLIEMIVAMVIASIVVSSLFQLLQGHGRFIELQSARKEVQQNARAALELISTELRPVAAGGLVEMEPQRIRFFQPRAWGILCDPLTPLSTEVWGAFAASVLPDEVLHGRQHWGIAVEQTEDPRVRTGRLRYVPGPAEPAGIGSCAGVQGAPAADRVTLGFQIPSGALVEGDSVAAGAPVMIYEEVAYDVASSTSGAAPGVWVRRMVGYSGAHPNMQPLAGPVVEEEGLAFTYLQADGVTPATTPSEVRLVGIRVIARSSRVVVHGGAHPQMVDTAATVVSLRNADGGGP